MDEEIDETFDEPETLEPKPKKVRKPKDEASKFRCSNCGNMINPRDTPPGKTWNMISPLPDKLGRVTLTIMGSFTCPQCHKNLKVAMQKIKSDDDANGKSKKDILLNTVRELKEKTLLTDIATRLGLSGTVVVKAVNLLIQRGEINGKIENECYLPSKE